MDLGTLAKRRPELKHWFSTQLMEPITNIATLEDKGEEEREYHRVRRPDFEEGTLVLECIRELVDCDLWPVEPRHWNFDHTLRGLKGFVKDEYGSECCNECCLGLQRHVEYVALEFERKLNEGIDPEF